MPARDAYVTASAPSAHRSLWQPQDRHRGLMACVGGTGRSTSLTDGSALTPQFCTRHASAVKCVLRARTAQIQLFQGLALLARELSTALQTDCVDNSTTLRAGWHRTCRRNAALKPLPRGEVLARSLGAQSRRTSGPHGRRFFKFNASPLSRRSPPPAQLVEPFPKRSPLQRSRYFAQNQLSASRLCARCRGRYWRT